MKRVVVIAVLIAFAVLVVWKYPLFHIVRIDGPAAANGGETFNAAQFADKFWRERLVPSLANAATAESLIESFKSDSKEVRTRLGRSVGVSRKTLYVVQAGGTIVSADQNAVGVATKDGGEADIVLQTGPLFGNAVRDCSGLVRAGEFANSQHFNEISAELNRIVETRVIEPLKGRVKVGQRIQIVGCAELANDTADVKPLKLIPLQVHFE
jgi:predicted lipoprotein